jgi:hypothetical protein
MAEHFPRIRAETVTGNMSISFLIILIASSMADMSRWLTMLTMSNGIQLTT